MTLIYFATTQCPSAGTTWCSASGVRNAYTRPARDLRLPRRTSGSVVFVDHQRINTFVIAKLKVFIF